MKVTVKCPFCGNENIEYGLALCRECHAEVEYDVKGRQVPVPPEVSDHIERLEAEFYRLRKKSNERPWWMPTASLDQQSQDCIDQQKRLLDADNERARKIEEQFLASRDRMSEVSFVKNDRTIIVEVWLPADDS